ncbi:MAG: hypothetical protein HYX75_13045 [Acidobacteria bacterium]|nr:hypothetical protein [Acidobacteriota bacterium]
MATTPTDSGSSANTGLIAAGVILVVCLFATFSMNPARAGLGLKGDESTYVAMGLSAAYDWDFTYERVDLDRFFQHYQSGPEGIFLKRGTRPSIDVDRTWPFLHLGGEPDSASERLYFGKALSYPLAAAPFIRLAGLRGFYMLHALLLATGLLAVYAFLATRSSPTSALLYALAFFGASVMPTYVVRYYSDFFIFSTVLYAYFLWLYKEVAPAAEGRWARFLRSPASDIAAAAILAVATYSKPLNLPLAAPIVLTLLWRRRWVQALKTGAVYGACLIALFAINVAITGEANYQGGDRKTFYGKFPFENAQYGFNNRGTDVTTNEFTAEDAFEEGYFLRQFARNWFYFFFGRHTGFIPFFFPGALALLLYLISPGRRQVWRLLIVAAALATQSFSMIWMAHNWAGGGGQPGNRYFLGIYPMLVFLLPPLRSMWPGLVAWVGGVAFVGHLLVNPFVASSWPWINTQYGLLRLLPIEMTMPNDLPIMLNQQRSRIPYGENPQLKLYFLDDNAWLPELGGIWVAGRARTEILIRVPVELSAITVSADSMVPNRVTIKAGRAATTIVLKPGSPVTIDVPAKGYMVELGYSYVLEVETESGIVPRLAVPGSRESRFLGAFLKIAGVPAIAVVFP